MKKNVWKFFACALIFMSGCATTVARVDTSETIDLSGRWNDTDSRLVSEEMVSDALARPWLKNFIKTHKGNSPTVIVGTVKNRSHEHINVQTFVKDLELALINSGEVEFVASQQERGELRDERRDQASHSSERTAKSEGEEIGADFMLKGTINTIQDKISGKSLMFYQVNLELIHIETHKKVWIGEKKIKKFIEKSRLRL
ncbi:MAG: penicillin-binding protein activator LpoB [bacterium]|nr:penicillin-binding protein activator LpoB [bacterium]